MGTFLRFPMLSLSVRLFLLTGRKSETSQRITINKQNQMALGDVFEQNFPSGGKKIACTDNTKVQLLIRLYCFPLRWVIIPKHGHQLVVGEYLHFIHQDPFVTCPFVSFSELWVSFSGH